ncbi:hypothetical protein ACT3UM_23990 [Halomonas sp. AOP13-D3-9]
MLTAFTQFRITTRHTRVSIVGSVLTDITSDIELELRELGYPLQEYIPCDDLRRDLMTAFGSEAHCFFQDDAAYFFV